MKPYNHDQLIALSGAIIEKLRREDPSLSALSKGLLLRELWSTISAQNDVVRGHLSSHFENMGEFELAEKMLGIDMPGDYEWPNADERPQS